MTRKTANEIDIKIGKAVLAIRQLTKMPQGKLARRLGLWQSKLSRVESGQRQLRVSELFEMSHIFNFSLDKFRDEVEKLKQ